MTSIIRHDIKQGWHENEFGDRNHYVDDNRHSINDEPSLEYSNDSYNVWHKDGQWHRETGPALIWTNGKKEYYFKHKEYSDIKSDLEWLLKVEELKKSA